MLRDALDKWLAGIDLTLDQKILAQICLSLASDFDEKSSTPIAAEFRKTYLELKRSIGDTGNADPLEALLKR